jgi:hypothetical protein
MYNGPFRNHRRCFDAAAFTIIAAFSHQLCAQPDPPAGSIRVIGRNATFTVNSARPMQSVAYTFIQEYGWPVTFEEAPIAYAGEMVDATVNFSAGIRAYDPRGGRLEFSYRVAEDGKRPSDPLPVLIAAIEAYHQAGLPGRYEVASSRGYFHIVPTAHHNERGILQPVRSALDAIVTVGGGGRSVWPVFNDFVRAVERASGYRIGIGNSPFCRGDQASIEQRFENVQGRVVLRALIGATGQLRPWLLMCKPGRKECALSILY